MSSGLIALDLILRILSKTSHWSTHINRKLVSQMFSGTEFRYVLVVTSGTWHSANLRLSSSMSTSSSCDVFCLPIPRA